MRESSTFEFWRARAMPNGAAHARIIQFSVCIDAAKHQSAARHVAAAGKIDGEFQALAERLKENIDVLSGGDGAEKHKFTIASGSRSQFPDIAQKRTAIERIF